MLFKSKDNGPVPRLLISGTHVVSSKITPHSEHSTFIFCTMLPKQRVNFVGPSVSALNCTIMLVVSAKYSHIPYRLAITF